MDSRLSHVIKPGVPHDSTTVILSHVITEGSETEFAAITIDEKNMFCFCGAKRVVGATSYCTEKIASTERPIWLSPDCVSIGATESIAIAAMGVAFRDMLLDGAE